MEFPRVFWIDASMRFNTGNLSLTLDEVYESGGVLTLHCAYHSHFEATHPGMYRYLPIPASVAIKTLHYESNAMYFHRNELVYNRVVAWWVLCALEEACFAPARLWACNFKGPSVWAGCHRCDQSSLITLMLHHLNYEQAKLGSKHRQSKILRGVAHKYQLTVCPDRRLVKSAVYFARR